jgi:uncharacterized protein with HEPN domain
MSRELSHFDRIRLLHMLDAARQAIAFAEGRDREDLEAQPMFRRAVLHCIQEIGEAATRVSLEGRELTRGLPWPQIVGMRNRLVHVYFDVDLDLVWEVIVRDLPVLVRELQDCLGDLSDSEHA